MKNRISMATLRGVPVCKSIDFACECGFDGIEIQYDYLPEEINEQAKVIEYAKEKGLNVSLHAPCGDINISALNKGILRESVEQIKKTIDLAEKFSLSVVTFHPGRLSSAREVTEDKWNVLLEGVGKIADYAKEKKVYAAIENMENRKKELVLSWEDLNRFNDIGKDNEYFGITLDFSHFATNNIYACDIGELKLPVYNVHLSQCMGDKPHLPLYEKGDINIKAVLTYLDKIHYSANIVLELKSIYDAEIYKKSREVI